MVACFTRQARSKPPTWQPYCTADGCHLCKSSFVWNSTFKSEAQECRDKHNCRACGKVRGRVGRVMQPVWFLFASGKSRQHWLRRHLWLRLVILPVLLRRMLLLSTLEILRRQGLCSHSSFSFSFRSVIPPPWTMRTRSPHVWNTADTSNSSAT